MPHIIEITDLSAPELDVFARLTEAQLRSRRAPERALVTAESPTVIGHALDAGYAPVSPLVERRQPAGTARDLRPRRGDEPLDDLEARVHEVENVLYPEVRRLVAEGRVTVGEDRKVHIAPAR